MTGSSDIESYSKQCMEFEKATSIEILGIDELKNLSGCERISMIKI